MSSLGDEGLGYSHFPGAIGFGRRTTPMSGGPQERFPLQGDQKSTYAVKEYVHIVYYMIYTYVDTVNTRFR